MPVGGPKIGRSVLGPSPAGRATTTAAEELTVAPENKVLGTLDPSQLTRLIEDEVAPWERDPRHRNDPTDARTFVDVPDEWELRWLNPAVVDQVGMRHWQAVPAAGHDRVHVKVGTMIAPDNTIRRGSHRGAFLAFMPKSWIASRDRLRAERIARATQSAVDRQAEVTERVRQGQYGNYVQVDSARHPTHTMGDGRTMHD